MGRFKEEQKLQFQGDRGGAGTHPVFKLRVDLLSKLELLFLSKLAQLADSTFEGGRRIATNVSIN